MLSFLKNLRARLRQSRKRPSAPPRDLGVRLHLEAMEGRLALSTSSLLLATPDLTPALGASAAPHAESTAGTSEVVSPDCVCGYKHRGPCCGRPPHLLDVPWPVEHLSYIPGETMHLVTGAADGPLVGVAGKHHVVPHSPEGPLPTAVLFTPLQ
jgi:hypothetical protein